MIYADGIIREKNPVGIRGVLVDIAKQKKAEGELREVRKIRETLFKEIGNLIVILDSQNRIVDVNPAVLRATGKSLEEIKGMKCWEIFHDPHTERPVPGCPCERMKESGRFETVEIPVETIMGNYIISCTPLFDDKGRLENVVHIATEIPDRKKVERSLHG
jgi:PAS domain S-box-containing protein